MNLAFIQDNAYLLLFVVAIPEGPIATFIASGLAAQHILRLELVFLICFLGDLIGDIVRYSVGKFIGTRKYIQEMAIMKENKTLVKKWFKKSPFVFLLIIKFTPFLAVSGLIFSGSQKMKFLQFLLYSALITFVIKVIFVMAGYLGSVGIEQMRTILTGWKRITGSVIICIIFFFLAKKLVLLVGGYMKGWVTKK